MSWLLFRASFRFLLGHPTQCLFALLGIALGVAGAVAIELANASATRAFALTTEAVAGRATHQVTGGPTGLPDELVARLVRFLGPGRVAPVIEGPATVTLAGGRRALRLLGVDPFSEGPFRPTLGTAIAGRLPAFETLLTRSDAALLSTGTAAELGLRVGDRLELDLTGRHRSLEIVGLLDPPDDAARETSSDLVILDLAAAQEVLGRVGRIDRLDLRLDGDHYDARLVALLPPDAQLEPAAARSRTLLEMTHAFRFNLAGLSYLAVLCGAFLIYNATTFAVVQRRRLLGMLRALGVTRGEIVGLILTEAALLGLVGSALGLAAGVWLADGLLGLVTRTINDLYFALAVNAVTLDPLTLAAGLALGLGATLVAALPPALEAARVAPGVALARSTLEARARRHGVPRAAALGAALGLLGGALLWIPSQSLPLAFSGFLATVVGAALLTPGATVLLLKMAEPLLALFGNRGRMAARGVVTSLSRTGVALAALTVAVSVTVGVGVMIASFRAAVEHWLDGALVADIYVSPPGGRPGVAAIDPAALAALGADADIAGAAWLRHAFVVSDRGPVRLLASDLAAGSRDSWRLLQGKASTVWPAIEAGAVLVADPFAYRTGLKVGDRLRLTTASGPRDFPVAGIFEDYSADRGAVLISREVYRRDWHDDAVSAVGIRLLPGADSAAVVRRLRAATALFQALDVRATGTLKRNSLEVFDRTFAVTAVLRLIAGLVAFVGVVSALGALALDRARELGVLRALGLTPGELGGLVTVQSALLGLLAGLFSLPLGWLLAAIMVRVINRRSFGWSLDLILPPEVFVQAVLLAVGAALLAGLYPAWKMARTPPALALREE